MLASLRHASRILTGQLSGVQDAAALASRMFSSQAGALTGLLAQQQPFSLSSLFGMQQAVSTAPVALAAATPLLGRHALTPPAPQAVLNLQQQQPGLLPDLGQLIGGLQGVPRPRLGVRYGC